MAVEQRGVWFSNLMLLGFDPSEHEDKYKISFHKDMFDLPNNRRGMEIVLHYLFVKLDPTKANTEFRHCWLVYDKKQEHSFRKVCVQWLATIAREEPHSDLPRQATSLLLSPEGERFYSLLLNFSYYCVKTVLNQMLKNLDTKIHVHTAVIGGCGNIDPTLLDAYEHSLSIGIINHTHHLITRLQLMNDQLHPHWRQYALELCEEYRNVSKKRNENISLLSELKKTHGNLQLSQPIRDNEREIVKSKVLKLWKDVESFIKSTTVDREILHDIVTPSHDCHVINGKDLQYKIPAELSSGEIDHTPSDEPLDMARLLKTGNDCLLILKNQLLKGIRLPELTSLKEELDFGQSELSQHKGHVQSAQATRIVLFKHYEQITTRITELKQSIKLLQQDQESNNNDHNIIQLPTSFKPASDMLLAPPSPAPPLLPDTSGPSCTPLKRLSLPQHYTVSTPFAVDKLTKEMSARYRHGNIKESSIPLKSNRSCSTANRSQDHTYSLNHTPLKYVNQSKTRASELRNPNVINSPLLTNTPLLTYDNKLLPSTDPVSPHTDPVSHHTDPVSHHTDPVSLHTDPVSHHTDPVSLHTDPVSPDPVSRHTDPVSPLVNHTDPVSHHTDPVSPLVNHTDPVSTPFTNITNQSLDSLANKIANEVFSDDNSSTKSGSGHKLYYNESKRIFITPGSISPHTDELSKQVIADDSSLEFDLMENEIPPTPYRDVGLMSPDDVIRTNQHCNSVIPLILDDSVLS